MLTELVHAADALHRLGDLPERRDAVAREEVPQPIRECLPKRLRVHLGEGKGVIHLLDDPDRLAGDRIALDDRLARDAVDGRTVVPSDSGELQRLRVQHRHVAAGA